jgi:hypothetical protein
MRAIHVSYDGLLDPLGESQVVAYGERLSRLGVEMTLVSFEKAKRLTDPAAGVPARVYGYLCSCGRRLRVGRRCGCGRRFVRRRDGSFAPAD